MSKRCRAYSESKLGLEPPDNRKAFYAGWDAALRTALAKPTVKDSLTVEGALRRENERLREELVEAEAVRERCNERAFRLESENERLREENERLRDELRQSSIDHTRAEVERLRDALEIIAGYRPCIDSLMGNRDIAIAALRREGTNVHG